MLLQVLGREGPFPLILLPQFGGYWIEGTNHEITSIPETEPLQSPTTKVKLECNHTARLYRKHFLGKVGWPAGLGVLGWVGRGSPPSPGGGGWAGQPSQQSRGHASWIRSFSQQTRMAPRQCDARWLAESASSYVGPLASGFPLSVPWFLHLYKRRGW